LLPALVVARSRPGHDGPGQGGNGRPDR